MKGPERDEVRRFRDHWHRRAAAAPTASWRPWRRSAASCWSRTSTPTPTPLASMLGLKALIEHRQPGKPVVMTVDGMIARAENQAMVELIPIPLVPVEQARRRPDDGGGHGRLASPTPAGGPARPPCRRSCSTTTRPAANLDGVLFRDIRPNIGATSTMVTGYLLEQARRRSRPRWPRPCSTGSSRRPPATPARPARSTTAPWSGSSPAPTRTCSPGSATPSCPRATSPLPARPGQRLPLPRRDRELVRRCPPARHHRRAGRLLHPVRSGQLGPGDRPVRATC